MANVAIQKKEFDLLVSYIYDSCGIHLDDTKVQLVESRLSDLLHKYELVNYMELYEQIKVNDQIATDLVDEISTNETSFFRDSKIFESLIKHLFETQLDRTGELQIWSAACSFGQEPYTLAMILKELIFDLSKYKIQITATDISTQALHYASLGIYSTFEVNRGLTERRILRHFEKEPSGQYKIKDELRSLVYFKNHNLLKPAILAHRFEIVLCRNVAIYFDKKTKQQIFKHIADLMVPGGVLIVGSSEILIGINDRFERKEWNDLNYYQLKDY
ncbi:MAG: chemotaxis protein CheR [Gammaproteobacteria bacterium]|nr:MAG: chemotaxis protein CheR [Gammaproteobacteria bacterium]